MKCFQIAYNMRNMVDRETGKGSNFGSGGAGQVYKRLSCLGKRAPAYRLALESLDSIIHQHLFLPSTCYRISVFFGNGYTYLGEYMWLSI